MLKVRGTVPQLLNLQCKCESSLHLCKNAIISVTVVLEGLQQSPGLYCGRCTAIT